MDGRLVRLVGGIAGGVVGILGGLIGRYFSIKNTHAPRSGLS